MKLLIVDDHAIVRSGVRRLLAALPDLALVEAATGEGALELLSEEGFGLVILDLGLPGLGGLELLRRLVDAQPKMPILVFSTYSEPVYVARALELGARGYVSKNAAPQELLAAIKTVLGGRAYVEDELVRDLESQGASMDDYMRPLTARDIEIMRLLAGGRSLAQIAATLGVAYKTVANTCTGIKEKLGVSRTADLIRVAMDRRLA